MNPKSNSSFVILSVIVVALCLLTTTAKAEGHGKCLAPATFAKKAPKAPKDPSPAKRQKGEVTAAALPEKKETEIGAGLDVGAMSGVVSTHLKVRVPIIAFTDTTPDGE